MVDGKADTVYTGGSDGEDPVIMLDMGKPTEVTSLRYTLGAGAKGSAIRGLPHRDQPRRRELHPHQEGLAVA